MALLFAGIGSVLSWLIGSWNALWIAVLPILVKGIEMLFSSQAFEKRLLKWYMPKADAFFNRRIEKNLRQAETPYKEIIIQQAKAGTTLWVKCQMLLDSR